MTENPTPLRKELADALWQEMERHGGGWNADKMANVCIAVIASRQPTKFEMQAAIIQYAQSCLNHDQVRGRFKVNPSEYWQYRRDASAAEIRHARKHLNDLIAQSLAVGDAA